MGPLGLVPARGQSRRLPGKHLAVLHGKPLIAYTIEAARESGIFDEVYVSTDSVEIAAIARDYGAAVPFLRPADLASDTATLVDACLHALDYFDQAGQRHDTVCMLQATCPLRTAVDIAEAWALFARSGAPFLMSVTDFDHPPFWALEAQPDGTLAPFWGCDVMRKTQELPRLVRPNGAIAIANVQSLRRERTFYAPGLIGYSMPRLRSIDVDEPIDLALAEWLLNRQPIPSPPKRVRVRGESPLRSNNA